VAKVSHEFWSPRRLALAVGTAAGLAVVLTLGGPGVTTDEPLDVRPGRTYVETLEKRGLGFFAQATVDAVFRDNAEHPPLGRWLLGIASTLGQPLEIVFMGEPDPLGLYVHAARLAPALCFALLVGLVTHTASRRYGVAAGAGAGFSLAVMPRVFAHAHLGALDTFITFFWVLALFAAERGLNSRRPVAVTALAGVAWGLALLTKIHAWLLIPVVLAWSVVRLGPRRGLAAFSGWAVVGFGLFFAGWPWLWFDPVGRLSRYLGTGVERVAIQVTYFGQVYADRDVPWHYPWLYFAVTVPVGLQLLGALGLADSWRRRRDDRFPLLLVGSILLLLGLFSTRVPVYDGERLFLMVFPLWAVLIGRGFGRLWDAASGRSWLRVGLSALLVGQAYGVVAFHPFDLSYYNALVGGLSGAERLGLELTFWGDAVDPVLLDRLVREAPEGASVALVPTLYPGQGIATTTRAMARRSLIPQDESAAATASWVIVSRRTAYWPASFRERMGRGRVVATRSRQGVWLSAVYAFDPIPHPSNPPRSAPVPGSSSNDQGPSSQPADDL
jgi:4-amino-4-deoxy-L-arabinose transferase-like glycosyltransferase